MTESLIGKSLVCTETGKTFIGESVGFTTNYAKNGKGEVFSDEGVDIREKRELLDRTKPYYAYVNGDGKLITGWKGNKLAEVYQSWSIALAGNSHFHSNKSYKFFRVRDIHGKCWYGRGSVGLCITLYPYKNR